MLDDLSLKYLLTNQAKLLKGLRREEQEKIKRKCLSSKYIGIKFVVYAFKYLPNKALNIALDYNVKDYKQYKKYIEYIPDFDFKISIPKRSKFKKMQALYITELEGFINFFVYKKMRFIYNNYTHLTFEDLKGELMIKALETFNKLIPVYYSKNKRDLGKVIAYGKSSVHNYGVNKIKYYTSEGRREIEVGEEDTRQTVLSLDRLSADTGFEIPYNNQDFIDIKLIIESLPSKAKREYVYSLLNGTKYEKEINPILIEAFKQSFKKKLEGFRIIEGGKYENESKKY